MDDVVNPGPRYRMTIPLIKRLAEAVDGLRGETEFWLVARYEPTQSDNFDYQIKRWDTEKEALDDAADKNQKEGGTFEKPVFGAFGPFLANDGIRRDYKIMNVTLTVRRGEIEENIDIRQELAEEGVRFEADDELPCDALFWSLSALEKFAEPYYTRAGGLQVASRLRTSFLSDQFLLAAHLPSTDWVNPETARAMVTITKDRENDKLNLEFLPG